MTRSQLSGSEKTKQFYDTIGWRRKDGAVIDRHLFGVKEDGPIRMHLFGVHTERVHSALKLAGDKIKLLECGCGGSPSKGLLKLCSTYNGIDFSETGLEEAKGEFADAAIPCDLRQADVCHLPFADSQFDAVYSAHMLYHIPDTEAQKAALLEMLRVIRPDGVLVLITANPHPLMFPVRFLMRILAGIPVMEKVANALGRKSPLPYKPMPLSWLRRQIMPYGSTALCTYGLPSTSFNQNVTEYKGIGK